MKVICTRCGKTNITCEAWINPNEKEFKELFDHYSGDSFDYGSCNTCDEGCILTDVDQVQKEIEIKFNEFVEGHQKEPAYACVSIVYCDDENSMENVNIKLSAGTDPDDEDKFYYYCNCMNHLKVLCDKGIEGFIVVEILSFEE